MGHRKGLMHSAFISFPTEGNCLFAKLHAHTETCAPTHVMVDFIFKADISLVTTPSTRRPPLKRLQSGGEGIQIPRLSRPRTIHRDETSADDPEVRATLDRWNKGEIPEIIGTWNYQAQPNCETDESWLLNQTFNLDEQDGDHTPRHVFEKVLSEHHSGRHACSFVLQCAHVGCETVVFSFSGGGGSNPSYISLSSKIRVKSRPEFGPAKCSKDRVLSPPYKMTECQGHHSPLQGDRPCWSTDLTYLYHLLADHHRDSHPDDHPLGRRTHTSHGQMGTKFALARELASGGSGSEPCDSDLELRRAMRRFQQLRKDSATESPSSTGSPMSGGDTGVPRISL